MLQRSRKRLRFSNSDEEGQGERGRRPAEPVDCMEEDGEEEEEEEGHPADGTQQEDYDSECEIIAVNEPPRG